MSQLSEKELSTIKDLLAEEELLVKKFQMLAEHAETTELKCKMQDISKKHQGHFNELYQKLSQEGIMPGIYTEKEIYGDALAAQKTATSEMNKAANECVHEDVRKTMMNILNQEHEIQKSVFDDMHAAGYYPTPAAEEKKVQDAKQKFSQCVK